MGKVTKQENRAKEQAEAQYNHIKDLLEKLEEAETEDEIEEATRRINESPLSVTVRSGYQKAGQELKAEEYKILLSTGGPAVRIVGRLNEYDEPVTAELQYQDWFEKWKTERNVKEQVLLDYAQYFYFGA